MSGFILRTSSAVAALLALAAVGEGCARMKVRSRVYPPAESPYAYAVATDTTELLAREKALEEGKSYCLKIGKEFVRRRSQAIYQGQDRSTEATNVLLSESIGPAWEDWAGQKDFRVVIEFECRAP